MIRNLVKNLREMLNSPDLHAQMAAMGINTLQHHLTDLTEQIPVLTAQVAELTGEATRLSDLIEGRRRQLAEMDDALSERLCEERSDELDKALDAVTVPELEDDAPYSVVTRATVTGPLPMDPAASPAAFAGDDKVPQPRRRGLGHLLP